MSIPVYDSRRPLSDYEIGSVHSFHVDVTRLGHLFVEAEEIYPNCVKVLNETIKTDFDTVCCEHYDSFFVNVIGVVVDAHKSSIPEFADQITVMFKTNTNNYVLSKYAVRSQGVAIKENKYNERKEGVLYLHPQD